VLTSRTSPFPYTTLFRSLARLGRQALEQLGDRRRVLLRVLLDRLVDDEAHSTLPISTQALWPPRPIAFESATSTSASRASFGTRSEEHTSEPVTSLYRLP